MITAVIAEKPSVAKDIANVLNVRERHDGYLSGNGYLVTWAFGHLVQLAMPEAYGYTGFRRENLPILPQEFKYIPRQIREGKEYKPDPGVLKQLKVIREVFDRSDRIVVATDAGREGEAIHRYIYNYLGCRKPCLRLWISSLTDRAIREGLDNLKPGSDYDNLYRAAEARAIADWEIGLNATQALSIAAGQGIYSLGRVQTPTLMMICSRYLENRDFTPQTYYRLKVTAEKDGTPFAAISELRYETLSAANAALAAVTATGMVEVADVQRREVSQEPPLLYDLTALQKEANGRYGFSADKTFSVAQSLYEKKVLSYPRTGSRYLSDDVFDEIPDRIALLERYPAFATHAAALKGASLNRRSVDAGKVTDHHALIITECLPGELSADERTVYDMVAARLLEACSKPSPPVASRTLPPSPSRRGTACSPPRERSSGLPDGVPCGTSGTRTTREQPLCRPCSPARLSPCNRRSVWRNRPSPVPCTPRAACFRRWSIAAGICRTTSCGIA